jgi:signal transduction histidine kinase
LLSQSEPFARYAPRPKWEQQVSEETIRLPNLVSVEGLPSLIRLTWARSGWRSPRNLLASFLELACSSAIARLRQGLWSRLRHEISIDARRTSLLARVLGDSPRPDFGFREIRIYAAQNADDSPDLVYHSAKPDISLDRPRHGRSPLADHAFVSRRAVTSMRSDGAGIADAANSTASIAAPIWLGGEDGELVGIVELEDPVLLPEMRQRTPRLIGPFDLALCNELAELAGAVIADHRAMRDLSHTYELAFHSSGRTVGAILGALEFVQTALFGGQDESDEHRPPPMFEISSRRPDKSPELLERQLRIGRANAVSLQSQVLRFEYSKPHLFRFNLGRIDKPLKECLTPALRVSQQYELVHQEGRPSKVNRFTQAAEMPAAIMGDPKALIIVFSNLFENAIKYRKRPNVADITISWRNEERHVIFEFRDKGVGIHEGEEEKIFRPYARGKHPLQYGLPGQGLGLPTIRQLLSGMGGQVSAVRVPDGLCIRITLQRAA